MKSSAIAIDISEKTIDMKKIAIIFTALLCILVGCTDAPEETKLTVALGSIERGLNIVDMDTAYYMVTVQNTDKDINYGSNKVTGATLTLPVAEGNTTVAVRAYNKDDIEIGNGIDSINVRPYQENVIRITVNEIQGSANLNIAIDTTIKGVAFTAEIYKDVNSPAFKTVELSAGQDGIIRGSVNLETGYYLVKIKDATGKYYGKIETVKIFKDADITYNAYVGEDKFDVTIEIENAILPTPSITISGGKAQYANGESYSLTAAVKNIDAPTYQWFIDETPLVGETEASVTGTLENLKEGKHYFTVLAKNDKVQWTGNHEFTLR